MKEITKYEKALNLINESHYILIMTHMNPDADTISCALALSNYFSENKIKHKVFNKMSVLPSSLDYLSKFDKITDQFPKFYDLAIYVDCGDIDRPAVATSKDVKILNIDHHKSNNDFGEVNIVDISKASTAEVLYEFFAQNNLKISKNTAECLYTGVYDDSLQFSTPRTDASTFKIVNKLVECGVDPSYVATQLTRRDSLAKYRLLPRILDSLELHCEGEVATIYVIDEWLKESGASYRECENAVNMILNISIVQISIFLRVSNGKTRISLRSKKDDVSIVANAYDGGGHALAAGCSYDSTDVIEAKNNIVEYIKRNRN